MLDLNQYEQIWTGDAEFLQPDGERPEVICMVLREFHSGCELKLWEDELAGLGGPPFPTGPETPFVCYYAIAEINCFRTLGWPVPERILDLYAEFRNVTNGLYLPAGNGLLGALTHFNLPGIDYETKQHWRDRIMEGPPYLKDDRAGILDYCASDVHETEALLRVMAPGLNAQQTFLRGAAMAAFAAAEWNGVPIDMPLFRRLLDNWEAIRGVLVQRTTDSYPGVFVDGSFKMAAWAEWTAAHGIKWPRLKSGKLALEEKLFSKMAKSHPEVAPIHAVRTSLAQLRLNSITIGADGRNRCGLSPFKTITSRNAPSTSRFIFAPATWVRNVIQPPPGTGLAHLDYGGQELAIMAVLSGDKNLLDAYLSGDPYMYLAIMAGAAPAGATKETHPRIRALYKVAFLATGFGQEAPGLAQQLGIEFWQAQALLDAHHDVFRNFWRWSDSTIKQAALIRKLQTRYGWTLHVDRQFNKRSVRNFLVQSTGSEILRWACILLHRRGIKIVATIHDSITVEAPLEELDQVAAITAELMTQASRRVLDGFELRLDTTIVRHPDHFSDPRGSETWREVTGILADLESSQQLQEEMFSGDSNSSAAG